MICLFGECDDDDDDNSVSYVNDYIGRSFGEKSRCDLYGIIWTLR